MATNEKIWGDKKTWIALNYSDVKLANFGNNKSGINDGITAGKIAIDTQLDMSIAHSALGTESALSHLHWYALGENFVTDNFSTTPFAFTTGFNSLAMDYTLFDTRDVVPQIYGSLNPYTPNIVHKPFVDFDYKTLRAVIHVVAQSDDLQPDISKTIDTNLSTYISQYKNTHKYIRRCYIKLYSVKNGVATELNTDGGKGIVTFNKSSCYTKIKKTSTEYHSENDMYLMLGNEAIVNYNTPNSYITVLGITSYDGTRTDTSDRINSRYINAFTDGVEVKFYKTSPYQTYGFSYAVREYDSGFEEYIKHQVACFGIQFVTTEDDIAINLEDSSISDATADKVYIGILDSNFVGHGDFKQGKAIKDTAQYKLGSANESPFDPTKQTDPNTYHDTSIKPINVDGNTSFTTKYVLNYGQLNSIAEDFYKALNTKPEDLSYSEYSSSLFLTNNAIDTVVSCKYFPFQLPMTGGENVKMGNYTIKVNNEPLVAPITSRKVSVYEFECGSCYGEFGDFRDFEPYTSYELKVPFCGSVRLNASECVGKSITVSLAVDIESGSCTGFVYAGDKLVESVSGSCGVDIPISAVQQATLDSQIFNASINQRQAKTNAVLSVAKGAINVGAGAYALSKAKTPRQIGTSSSYLARGITDSLQDISNSMYNAERANYNISHVEIPYKCVGAVSSGVCLSESLLCSLIKETPIMLEDYNPDVYAKTIGFACCKSGKIGSESGMVVCSDVRIENCTLTKTEKDMIIQLCKTGIIV